ncbi:MAG: MFS transporter, partial [Methanomicrobiales archaeon]|nr:MFS transporter [Methanomicrobiales archaeon]
RRTIIASGFAVMIAGGVLVCLFGNLGPLVFALALFPASLMGSSVRSPGAFLMLDQQKEDTGSASALINCSGLVFGSAGMVLVFLSGENLVLGLGTINVAVGVMCLAGWTAIGRRGLVKF